MNEHEPAVISQHDTPELSLAKYIVGFVGSVIITLAAYLFVTHHTYSKDVIVGIIAGLALVQFLVQMVFFLHLGSERKPRWKLAVMVFMVGVVFIIVFGSIWIMNNLNYRMTPQQQEQYLKAQDGGL
jgi:cytochrome o ubiquinol oxidase operon protein cyoD